MASIVLASVGSAIGSSIGGTFLGISATTIGGAVGSFVGSAVDSWAVSSLAPSSSQSIEGQRLDSLRVTTSTEGSVIPRLYGRMRIGGNVIWATDFREEQQTTTQGGGGKGGGGGGGEVEVTEYFYFASFAVALCEGPITGIGRVWADGKPLDMSAVTTRLYLGNEDQNADPFIASKMGGEAPAYRGVAYLVFEDMDVTGFGNRLPQITVEVIRAVDHPGSLEDRARAVTLIPSTGEFAYATTEVQVGSKGDARAVNTNTGTGATDLRVSLDRLEAALPGVESVTLVVSWFGDDLRCGECRIRPGVDQLSKDTKPLTWSVAGVNRNSAYLVSQIDGRPAYGGTPSDESVTEAIAELRARGYRITFYPFVLMDIPPGNSLPNPYSDNAAETGQPPFPWRGRITCSPAPGYAGSADKTATAGDQVETFFTRADGFRRFILHYAQLCGDAGGVDAFLIGTEMVGVTQIRSDAATYPAVSAFRGLAADVRAILGAGTAISYAADWSEYFGHQPGDGSGDVFFHLDPLWSDANIDFVAIDNYMPLADWRDGDDHADRAAGYASTHDLDYLRANVEGGEGYDWFYASAADRESQIRTPIADGAGKPWVFRYKDIRNWWSSPHYDRPEGIESATPTAWVPQSKPIRFTEIGCPAVDRGANQPNVFYDPKSSESFFPYFSRGWRDDAMQRAYLEAALGYWADHNETSAVYGGPMIDLSECALWTWDARPFPDFPGRSDVWSDGDNWRLGHWLTGRAGSAAMRSVAAELASVSGCEPARVDASALWPVAEGYAISAIESPRASLGTLARFFGFDAVESGGVIRFVERGAPPAATLTPDALVAGDGDAGEPLEMTRGQETELPGVLRWTVQQANEAYDAATVEASRIVGDSERVSADQFPIAAAPEEAERRCRRALLEVWAGREQLQAALPPSRLALDPGDVLELDHDGRRVPYRLTRVADALSRMIEGDGAAPAIECVAPGAPRTARLDALRVYGEPLAVLMNLPQLSSDAAPAAPYVAARASPWQGEVAIWRSPAGSTYTRVGSITVPAQIGELAEALPAGPAWRWDRGSEAVIDLYDGIVTAVPEFDALAGQNAFAIESAPGEWEIITAAGAELVSAGRYRLTKLLRGLRGTERAIGDPAPAGAAVVRLDPRVAELPVTLAEAGQEWQFRVGWAEQGVAGAFVAEAQFTPTARGMKPFAPAQPRARALAGGDIEVRWQRRSRDLAADSWSLASIPLAEDAETYDLEILDAGGAVTRTVSGLTEPRFVWTAAMQAADVGGPADLVRLRAYQTGTIGRGCPLDATIPITEATG